VVRDRLDGLWSDEDFAGWYPRDGRPGISPAQLAMVCVLQFLLDLPDRDAAEALRCRIDFKYALGLDLDDPGFHHSVLGDFRDRLLEDGRAGRLLDLALARLKEAGADARRLIEHLAARHPDRLRGPQVEALRQILVQGYHRDPAGQLRWRDDEGDMGLPPSAARIVSPYDPAARYSRRGQVTRWTGYLAHVTETCSADGPNVITDVATMPATSDDRQALAGIHARLAHRACSPAGTSWTAAAPPWSTWNGPAASTRSPSPGRCPATAPASTASRKATPAATSAPATTAGRHLPPGPGQQGVARPLPRLLARRRPAHRGPLHQGAVPALPGACRLHHLRRRQPHRGIPPARTARTAGPEPR